VPQSLSQSQLKELARYGAAARIKTGFVARCAGWSVSDSPAIPGREEERRRLGTHEF
jgi:hypothetical protein